jgi:hypothetical protein
MVRQCAWCLRLINSQSEPISTFPLPKLYEATHGMCQSCALLWLEAVEKGNEGQTEQMISHPEETDNKISLSLFGDRC